MSSLLAPVVVAARITSWLRLRQRENSSPSKGSTAAASRRRWRSSPSALRAEGIDVLTTREPGGTEIGERIRAVLLDSRTAGLDPWAEMALMFASRAQLIAR